MESIKREQHLTQETHQEISILLFGIARDIVGDRMLELQVKIPCTVRDLQQAILDRFPAFEDLGSLRIAVGAEYAQPDTPVDGTEEVALIPPVSGG